jgi:hypothetical protein
MALFSASVKGKSSPKWGIYFIQSNNNKETKTIYILGRIAQKFNIIVNDEHHLL